MQSSISKAIEIVSKVKSIVEELTTDMGVDSELLPCLKAHVLNNIILPLVFKICNGEEVDLAKAVLGIKKHLRKKVKILVDLCHAYRRLLTENTMHRDVIVDLGCGLGVNLNIARFYTNNPLLVGVDKNICFLQVLKKMCPQVEVLHADITKLPLRDSVVSIVFCTLVLHELPDLNAIREMARVLKNNGVALIIDIVLRFVSSKLLDIVRSLRFKIGFKLEIPYTLKQVETTLKSCGTRITRMDVKWKLLFAGIAVITAVKISSNDKVIAYLN